MLWGQRFGISPEASIGFKVRGHEYDRSFRGKVASNVGPGASIYFELGVLCDLRT